MKKKTRNILIVCFAILLFGIAGIAHIYYYFFAKPFQIAETTYIYIDRDDDVDSVYHKIVEAGNPKQMHGFESLVRYKGVLCRVVLTASAGDLAAAKCKYRHKYNGYKSKQGVNVKHKAKSTDKGNRA